MGEGGENLTTASSVRWNPTLGVLALLVFVALLQGPSLLAAAWGNVAYVRLTATAMGAASCGPQAEEALQTAQALAPTQREGLALGLGRLYVFQHRDAEAIRSLQEALAVCPHDPVAGFFLGQVLWDVGERDKAIGVWQQAGAAPHFLSLGQHLARANRLDEAIDAWRLALDINSQLGEAHLELGRALRKTGQPEEAIQELQRALDLCPGQKEAEIYLQLGHAYRAVRNLDKALWAYREAYARLPSSNSYLYLIGSVLLRQERFDEAERYLRLRVQATPHAPSHYQLARIYIQREDWAGAEEELREAVALAPSVSVYQERLGDVYLKQGQVDTAVEAYKTAFCLATPESGARARIAEKMQALEIASVECEGR